MKNIIIRAFFALTLTVLLAPARAATGGGESALSFLNLDIGARHLGMGGAAAGSGKDMTGVVYNPAVAGALDTFSIAGATGKMSMDFKNNFIGASVPVKFLSLTGNAPMVIGLSGVFSDYGDDISDIGGVPVTRNFGEDMAVALTLSENFLTHDWEMPNASFTMKHMIGVSAKYISSTLPRPGSMDDVDADTFAFDVGYLINVPEAGLGIGVALLNIGKDIRYIEEDESLPLTLRAGAAFNLVNTEAARFGVSADYIRYLEEKDHRVRVGAELTVFNILSLRGGYRILEEERNNFTLGVGLELLGFSVDYAMLFKPLFGGDVNQLSVSFRFPKKEEKKPEAYEPVKTKAAPPPPAGPKNQNPIIY
jgi:hypothetical protein